MKKVYAFLSVMLIVALASVYGILNFTVFNNASTSAESSYVATASQIKTIQTKLKNWGYYKGNIDGINGKQTIAAVKAFQRKNGLNPDGIVGSKTAAKMGISLQSGTNNNDLYLLAKCIHAEARGESYTGQVAVGGVILNRVKSSKFPNSIAGVIYQPYAFTAVADGQINLEPNDSSYKAAKDALNGWDPSYGAIYYYNPSTATSSWIFSRQIITTIGKHRFCK